MADLMCFEVRTTIATLRLESSTCGLVSALYGALGASSVIVNKCLAYMLVVLPLLVERGSEAGIPVMEDAFLLLLRRIRYRTPLSVVL